MPLDGNQFRRNGDAITTGQLDLSLRDNRAINNRRWGINARNATDLVGNVARGHGYQPQCVGVTC